jgi:hypothetical protein
MDFAIIPQLLGPLHKLIKELIEAKISVNKSIIINYQQKQVQYEIHVVLENNESKRTNFAKIIQSYFKEPLTFDNVLNYSCVAIPEDANLKKDDIMSLEGDRLRLDLAKLTRDIAFNILSVRGRCGMSQDFLQYLVIPTQPSTGKVEGNMIKTHMEVSLDYLSSWLKYYDVFEVQNIEFSHTILITPSSLKDVFPKEFSYVIMNAVRAYNAGNKKASDFFSIMSQVFLTFESELYHDRIKETIFIDSQDFEVVAVYPKMQYYPLSDKDGPGIMIPGSIQMTIRTGIRGSEVVKKANVHVDRVKLQNIFKDIIAVIKMRTKDIVF